MRLFRLVPDDTHIPFVRYQWWAYLFSGALVLLTLIMVPVHGLNFGIDFRGGILIEVRMPGEAADIGAMRTTLGGLGLGEVQLQEFGEPTDVLIRVERQAGDEAAQQAALSTIRSALTQEFGEGISYRRVEFVGPRVSEDLFWAGTMAVIFAVIAILAYVWFRFEWHFAVGAVAALVHDAVTTIGLFSLFWL
jgi:preprotein translocase subunit SecF